MIGSTNAAAGAGVQALPKVFTLVVNNQSENSMRVSITKSDGTRESWVPDIGSTITKEVLYTGIIFFEDTGSPLVTRRVANRGGEVESMMGTTIDAYKCMAYFTCAQFYEGEGAGYLRLYRA